MSDSPEQLADGQGRNFGPYQIFERLGVGGMATVHRAVETGIAGFKRVVALKRLLPHLADDVEFVKAFVREAQLAAVLSHGNIVRLYELGRVESIYFISMEYIPGHDLRRVLRRAKRMAGPPPLTVTLSILTELCDALDYAHNRTDDRGQPLGLVHRDISPSNLLVSETGHLKIIDFGIAKATSKQRTRTGRIKGKLSYMAPEALRGQELDARSDLFSVGVIAHELITASPLFAAKNDWTIIENIQHGEVVSPSSKNSKCPVELDRIVLRALAKRPDDRYDDAAAMRRELRGVTEQYHLHATNREVADWLEWTDSLAAESDGDGFGTGSHSHSRSRSPLSSIIGAPDRDEDELADVVWSFEENRARKLDPGPAGDETLDRLGRKLFAEALGDEPSATEPAALLLGDEATEPSSDSPTRIVKLERFIAMSANEALIERKKGPSEKLIVRDRELGPGTADDTIDTAVGDVTIDERPSSRAETVDARSARTGAARDDATSDETADLNMEPTTPASPASIVALGKSLGDAPKRAKKESTVDLGWEDNLPSKVSPKAKSRPATDDEISFAEVAAEVDEEMSGAAGEPTMGTRPSDAAEDKRLSGVGDVPAKVEPAEPAPKRRKRSTDRHTVPPAPVAKEPAQELDPILDIEASKRLMPKAWRDKGSPAAPVTAPPERPSERAESQPARIEWRAPTSSDAGTDADPDNAPTAGESQTMTPDPSASSSASAAQFAAVSEKLEGEQRASKMWILGLLIAIAIGVGIWVIGYMLGSR